MPLTAQKAHGVFFEYFESLFILIATFSELWLDRDINKKLR